MIETKLIVGRYFNFVMPKSTKGILGTFMTQPQISLTIQESTGFFTKTSNISAGTGSKAHRNFQWLNWVAGAVNQVAFGNLDVLTGPMSGCWIMKYKIAGIEYIGHVGTFNKADSPQSIASKTAWNAFANANPLDVVGGFKPKWNGVWPPSIKGDNTTGQTTFGLVTGGDYYTVAAWRKQDLTGYRIAGLQKDTSAALGVLQNI
jgi:hypothetical protein